MTLFRIASLALVASLVYTTGADARQVCRVIDAELHKERLCDLRIANPDEYHSTVPKGGHAGEVYCATRRGNRVQVDFFVKKDGADEREYKRSCFRPCEIYPAGSRVHKVCAKN